MIACCFGWVSQVLAAREQGVLLPGTTSETPWHIIDSGVEGPTVLITGGLHGNEPAGSRAAEQIKRWPIVRGKLVVMPRLNRLGLAANIRWSPEYRNDRKLRDLNRNFPREGKAAALTPLCQEVWSFISDQKPDWVFDLHEGFDFHRLNSESVGSSVISFPEQRAFAARLQAEVNKDVDAEKAFDLLAARGPVNGSLARACKEQLGAKAFILETTFKDQPLSLRTRQHRVMASTALLELKMIAKDCRDVLSPSAPGKHVRVALFDDAGANEEKLRKVIKGQKNLLYCQVGPRDMKQEVLRQFDLIIFPGGSGSKQGRALGEKGRKVVQEFIREGGGYLGVCAGAFLSTSHYDWSLHLMNASVFNVKVDVPGKGMKSMWYRGGPAKVKVEMATSDFGLSGTHDIVYHNGPILSPGKHPDLPAYETLAWFRSENGLYKAQKNTMINAPAIVSVKYGEGKVLALSPHFESTKGQESVVLRAIERARR